MTSGEMESAIRELKDAVARNTADLATQFQRIAQMQAELDVIRAASGGNGSRRKKSVPVPAAAAADTSHERRSRPR